MPTSLQLSILKTAARYYTLQRSDIQALCMPGLDDRTARRHLNSLYQQKLINKTNGRVLFPEMNGAAAPVYFPSKKGCELLYCETKDERYLTVCAYTPEWQRLDHWLAISRFHIMLDHAAEKTPGVCVDNWIGEWDIIDHQAKEPEKRFRLFTLAAESPRRLVFNPDAAFTIAYKDHRRGYYLEMDRSTSGIQQIAHSKTPSVPIMLERALHARHFPGAEQVPFRILMVTQNEGRRDALAKAIATKPGAALWRFMSLTKKVQRDEGAAATGFVSRLSPEQLFFEWDVIGCDAASRTLIKRMEGDQ